MYEKRLHVLSMLGRVPRIGGEISIVDVSNYVGSILQYILDNFPTTTLQIDTSSSRKAYKILDSMELTDEQMLDLKQCYKLFNGPADMNLFMDPSYYTDVVFPIAIFKAMAGRMNLPLPYIGKVMTEFSNRYNTYILFNDYYIIKMNATA